MPKALSTTVLVLGACLLAPALVAGQSGFGIATSERATWVMQDTKYKKLDTGFHIVSLNDPMTDILVTFHEQTTGATPIGLFDGNPKGRLGYTLWCNGANGTNPVAEGTTKVDRNGNAAFSAVVQETSRCNDVWVNLQRRGNYTIPEGTSVVTRLNASKLMDGPCTPDTDTLCLQDGRFEVEVDWNDGSRRGPGHPLPTANDAGEFYFFDADNTELLVKVLNGCDSPLNSFWVFAGAATNVEYTLTVTDTQSGQSRSFFNPLGQPSEPILDTSAFATCP